MSRSVYGLAAVLALAACHDNTDPVPNPIRLSAEAVSAPNDVDQLAQLVDRLDQEAEITTDQVRATLEGFLPSATAASSNDGVECVGVLTGTFQTVEVPPGAQCFLINSTVHDWVKALDESQLFIFNTQIGGNLHGYSPRSVQLLDLSRVEGHMHIQDASDPVFVACSVRASHIVGNHHCIGTTNASAWVHTNSVIDGSLNMKDNLIQAPYTLRVQTAQIGGNAHITHNTGTGLKTVNLNRVAKSLVCVDNDPPFVGAPNVARQAQGQCS
jgi:hypothetical protein